MWKCCSCLKILFNNCKWLQTMYANDIVVPTRLQDFPIFELRQNIVKLDRLTICLVNIFNSFEVVFRGSRKLKFRNVLTTTKCFKYYKEDALFCSNSHLRIQIYKIIAFRWLGNFESYKINVFNRRMSPKETIINVIIIHKIHPRDVHNWTPDFFQQICQITGRIHIKIQAKSTNTDRDYGIKFN